MIDADQGASEQQNADEPVQSSSVSSEFTNKLLNLDNPSLADNEIASLMDTTAQHAIVIPEITSSFTTTIPPPPPFLHPLQQEATPTPTPITFITTSINPTITLSEILNFASVFKFDQRVSAIESELSELKQTNQFAEAVSSIPGIVDSYIASKMKEAVDSIMKKIIKDQVKAQVSKIMPKIEKGRDEDKDEDPSAGSNRRKKRRKSGKDAETTKDSRSKENKSSSTSKDTSHHKFSGKSAQAGEPSHTVEDSDMKQDQEFIMGDNDEQPDDKEVTKADWFKKPERPPTPDLDWSKRRQVNFRPPQTWISQAALVEEPPTSFDEFNDTSLDFSAFVMNRLKIPNLTQEILVGPAFNLLNGTCKSIMELEYHLEECSKATTKHLNWHNPENKPYSFDLRKPLPLIQDHRGRQIIPKEYFINKDLEYLKGVDLSRRYSTSVTKTKAATYELKWIKDLVQELWSPVVVKRRIIAVTKLTIMKKYDYGNLEEIEVRRDDQQLYTFKEGDLKILRLQDIEDMLLLLVQQKLTNLIIDESDGTLNDVRTALQDIAAGIRMEYLPMRKWSNLDTKRARVMV
ncbi:hypothetical protein Tco_0349031 [Tanacetum coccineum]